MKFFLGSAIFLILFNSCSAPAVKNVAVGNSNFNYNNAADNSGSRLPNINNAVPPPPETTDAADAAPAANIRSPGLSLDVKKKGKGKFADTSPIDPNAERILAPAPDNSEISTAMDKQGQIIEIRTFNSNEQLAKVVRTSINPDNPVIKVYLKNSKILDLPKGKIENIFAAPADQILQAVGIVPQKTKPVRDNVGKKGDQEK